MFNGVTGSNQEIIFREEPSLLENPESSYEILNEFAEFLYECVSWIVIHESCAEADSWLVPEMIVLLALYLFSTMAGSITLNKNKISSPIYSLSGGGWVTTAQVLRY